MENRKSYKIMEILQSHTTAGNFYESIRPVFSSFRYLPVTIAHLYYYKL